MSLMNQNQKLIRDVHRLQEENAKLKQKLAEKPSGPTVIKYRDNPEHIAMIRKLQGRK